MYVVVFSESVFHVGSLLYRPDISFYTTYIRLQRVTILAPFDKASPQLFLWYSIIERLEHVVLVLHSGPLLVPRTLLYCLF